MTDYRLVVTRREPNPDYERQAAEFAEQQKRNGFYNTNMVSDGIPLRIVERTVLDVTLTEAEYIAVKRAAIDAAK